MISKTGLLCKHMLNAVYFFFLVWTQGSTHVATVTTNQDPEQIYENIIVLYFTVGSTEVKLHIQRR